MYIFDGSRKQIINAEFVERFCISEKDDATLIVASYSSSRPPVTLARYENTAEAKGALADLFYAISGGQAYFEMPESRLYSPEHPIKDARTKRRGGS